MWAVLELDRNPHNYFAEIQQVAFSPSNIVPGLGFSPDKMLPARAFNYGDAHRYCRECRIRIPPASLEPANERCGSA